MKIFYRISFSINKISQMLYLLAQKYLIQKSLCIKTSEMCSVYLVQTEFCLKNVNDALLSNV